MTADAVFEAKRKAIAARQRLESSILATRTRLRPGNLAGEAWDGVKEKGATLADDAVEAVKARPGLVSLALGAVALFFARKPIGRAVGNLISRDGIEDDETELNETAAAEA